ncbi:hypothetical protein [Deinococcus sp. PEB2-67]
MNHEIEIGLQGDFEARLASAVADASELFPNQVRALQGLAQLAQRRWIEYATGARALPDGRTLSADSGEYASSIKIRADGALKYVIYSDAPHAEWLEYGGPAWDMRKLLGTSDKVRISEDGHRYLIVPFRHKAPGALGVTMPQETHSYWLQRDRKSSVVSGHYREQSVQPGGATVTRNTYLWGDRLSARDLSDMGLDPEGAARNLVGMVRFQHQDRGGSYLTFRVISDASENGWQQPAQPGFAPAQATHDFIQQHYAEVMRIALEEDVAGLAGL